MSKRQIVLRLLREAGPRGVTTAEFLEAGCGSRFGARVQELREEGFVVDTRRVRTASYVYVLGHAPEPEGAPPADGAAAVEPMRLFEPAAAPANALCWDEAAA